MAEDKQSFLEILNSYFANLEESNIVAGTKQKITIPMEWIFTQKMDRALIEKAFINLICRANKQYRKKLSYDKYFYGNISSLDIETTEKGTNLAINARDGWTKVLVTADSELRGPFYAISEETLYQEIQKVYNLKNIDEISKKLDFSTEERLRLAEVFKQPEMYETKRKKVESAMIDAAHNLTDYYEYMSGEKRKRSPLRGIITQRKDNEIKRGKTGKLSDPRKSDIYDFKERAKILEEMKPMEIIPIDQIEDGNTVSKFSYVTYVYKNPREKQGYLFIGEPVEGTHNTRVKFVPQNEYEELQVGQNENKLVHLAEEFLEMSDKEFDNSRFSRKFYHTSIEKMREKYRRIVLGEKLPNASDEYRYTETDKILFDGERKLNKTQIKEIVKDVRHEEVSQVRGILSANTINRQLTQ